jgi:hypothetical protein
MTGTGKPTVALAYCADGRRGWGIIIEACNGNAAGAGAGAAASAADRAVRGGRRSKGVTSHQRPSRALHCGCKMILRPRSANVEHAVQDIFPDEKGTRGTQGTAGKRQPSCSSSIAWAFGTVLCKRRSTPAECARKQRQKCNQRETSFGLRALRHSALFPRPVLDDTADTVTHITSPASAPAEIAAQTLLADRRSRCQAVLCFGVAWKRCPILCPGVP